jgi:ERCC4-type nuclease
MAKRQPGRRKRTSKRSSEGRAKKDAKDFAKSVGGFIPGIGTVLGIESVYKSGKRLMNSGPRALKSIGKKRTKRIGKQIKKRFKPW